VIITFLTLRLKEKKNLVIFQTMKTF